MSLEDDDSTNTFEEFLEGWMVRQEQFLNRLLSAQRDLNRYGEGGIEDLVSRVLAHYREYYDHKSRAAQRDIFRVFAPSWFTPLELSLFWIGGFNPRLALEIATRWPLGEDLTEEQRRQIGRLRDETKAAERELSESLARVQESMAAPPYLGMARRAGWAGGGVDEQAVENLRSSIGGLTARADSLRMTTVERVVEVLSPLQKVRFLAAAAQLQLRIREWGLQKDAERGASNSYS